ncbi:lysophospholipid acyltransferase family protein [Nocardiopsis tropica]|uniref:lysophospholipid acyltransferase family protein n=1 Tax=Tsukamurella strandjordii TaxID=147577 RepID=UPI0031CE48DC
MAETNHGDQGLLYWLIKHVSVGPLITVVNRPTVEGLENVPTEGPALLAGNHLSIADWLFVPLAVPRRISYLAKSDYFTAPGISGKLQKFFYTQTGQVPIDRTGGDAATAALETAKKLLAEGRLVGMYPEGTRSPDGRLYRGRTGLVRIAFETGVPIIPVGVIGTDKVSPPGPFSWHAERVQVKFAKPIDPIEYDIPSDPDERHGLERTVTDRLMQEIQLLTGQEYVDAYSKKWRPGN